MFIYLYIHVSMSSAVMLLQKRFHVYTYVHELYIKYIEINTHD